MASARGLYLFVLLLMIIVKVKCRWLGTSDGVDHEINNMNPENASLLKLGISEAGSTYTSKKSCESIYGFLPCSDTLLESVFLIIMYSYLLMLGEEWLHKGSAALLLYFQNQRMAGSVFRVLMALPRVVMVIVSGALCTASDARDQVAFGIAMYAGSTVISLTGIWGVNVILNKEDLDSQSKPTKDSSSTGLQSEKNILSFLKDVGVNINEDTRGMAFVLLLSLIPFAVVIHLQLVFSDRVMVSISLIVSALSLCSYIAYQIIDPKLQARSVAHLKEEQFQEMFLMKLQNLTSECLYKAGKPNIEAIKSIFKSCDDGSGHLKPDELEKFIHDNIDDKDDDISIEFAVKEIIRHFDNDGKEGVSMEEFVQGCTKWLNKWNAPQNGLCSSHARFNKFVADHKVEDFSVIPKTLYKPLISNLRGNENGEAHEETIEKLFSKYDKDKDGEINYDELQNAIVNLGIAQQDPAGLLAKSIIGDLDTDGSGTINKEELMTRLKNLTEMANKRSSGNDDLLKFIQRFSTETMTVGKTKKEEPLNILYAVFGAATIYLFAGPFMESVIQFSNALNIPFLFTSFVVTPFFMNTKSMIYTLFLRKSSFNKSASLAFSELYGGLVMNNLMGLTTLLTIVYIRHLTWDYTAEMVTIVMIGLMMGTFAVTSETYNLWASVASFFLYGTSTIVFCVYAWRRN